MLIGRGGRVEETHKKCGMHLLDRLSPQRRAHVPAEVGPRMEEVKVLAHVGVELHFELIDKELDPRLHDGRDCRDTGSIQPWD